MDSLGVKAHSDNWAQKKEGVLRIVAKFLAHNAELDPKKTVAAWHRYFEFHQMPESIVCEKTFYEVLAKYMLKDYEIPVGSRSSENKRLSGGVVINYLCIVLNAANNKFAPGSDSTQRFFTCLDPNANSDSAKWLRVVKSNIVNISFERDVKAGTLTDHSATPLMSAYLDRQC